jgi:AraC-like DNA-binding protein
VSAGVAVATVLLPAERSRLDAAGHGCFEPVHRESIEDATTAVRSGAASALFLSVHRCAESDLPRVARFVREFPHVPAIALISRNEPQSAGRVLGLGASGVRTIVDITVAGGWHQLRGVVREPASPAVASIMAGIEPDIEDVPPDCRLFFELVVRRAPATTTVLSIARAMRTVPSSFMSRFFRAGLPSAKTYLMHARLVHAAFLFESQGYSIADVAHRLEYSSPQSFGRHLSALLGLTAGEFRRRMPFPVALARYRQTYLTPYRDRLLTFHPLGTMPGNHGPTAA